MAFSIGDRLVHWLSGNENYPYAESYRFETRRYTEDAILWLVFLPWKTSVARGRRWGLLPKIGTVIAFELPDAFVNADPLESKRILLTLTESADRQMAAYPEHSVRVLSYSASNGIGFYLANNRPIDRFVSVVTGCNLGESLWRSRGTRHIKPLCQKLGYDSHEAVDDAVREFLPENNVDNLPKRSAFYLGRHDEYYPVDLGLRVARAALARNAGTKIAMWPLGHFGVVLAFGTLNRMRRVKEIYS
jgi:hypothetical protein